MLAVNHHIAIWPLEPSFCLFIVGIGPNVWVIGVLKADLRTLRGYFKRCFEGYFSYRAEFPSYPPTDTLTDRFLHLTLFFYFAQVCKGPFEFVAEVF